MCLYPIKIKTKDNNNEEIFKEVPCGHCLECMQQKSTDICVRGIIEYKKWNKNYIGSFITLTYNNKYLPENETIKKQDYIVFIRELRRFIKKNENRIGIRALACGEYGTKKGRPHYHLMIFNWLPNDLKIDNSAEIKNGNKLYKSKILSEIWGKGRVVIGMASEQTVGYIAGYTSKKGFKKTKGYKKKPEFETRKLKEKKIIYNYKNIWKPIKWTTKNGVEYFKKVKIRQTKNYKKEYEFISTPRGKMGGLGSLNEEEIKKMIKNEGISLNCGKEVKTFSVPYYYKKKLKEILEDRKKVNEKIPVINLNNPKLENEIMKIAKFKAENIKKIEEIEEIIGEEELRIEEIKKQEIKIAEKHKMSLADWKKYKSKIKINKITNRMKNLKRDFEKIEGLSEVHSYKPWFLENEIGIEYFNKIVN